MYGDDQPEWVGYDDDEPIWHWIAAFSAMLAVAIIVGWAYMAVTG